MVVVSNKYREARKMETIYKCSKCGYQMIKDEVWVSDNMDDKRLYCYSHAPDDAIRLKDTSEPISNHSIK